MLDQAAVDVGEIIEQQKLSRFLIRLVSLSWIITFFDGFDMNVISYAAPYLATAYRLDRVMVGNIFSIGLVGTMIGGFLFGYLGDRFGRRPAIILATASFGVLTLGFALAESYGALLALRLITGIAIGGMLPLSWALNIEFAPKRYRSTVVTLVMIGYSLGTAMGGPALLAHSQVRVASRFRFRWPGVDPCRCRAGLLPAGIDPLPRQQRKAP